MHLLLKNLSSIKLIMLTLGRGMATEQKNFK